METESKIMELLNALENAILRYGRRHREVVQNPYWYFAERLGFKSKNHLYQIFQEREETKVQYKHLLEVLTITRDKTLAKAIIESVKDAYNGTH